MVQEREVGGGETEEIAEIEAALCNVHRHAYGMHTMHVRVHKMCI